MTTEDKGQVEKAWEQLNQQWKGQQMCLQSSMASLENTADLLESADDQITLITDKLDQIIRKSVDISSFTLADHRLVSDLKEMDDRLQSEMRNLSERLIEEERPGPDTTCPSSLCQAHNNGIHHLDQLRQRLEKFQSAAQALDQFLATVREVKAEISTVLANQDPSRQQNEADWEQERHSWQATMQQKLQTAVEQSDSVDSTLKAVGMTLTIDGPTVTCQDVVTSLSQQAADVEKELMRARKRERKDEKFLVEKEQIKENEEVNRLEIRQKKTGDDSAQQEHPTPSMMEEETELEAKRSRLEGDIMMQSEEGNKAQTWKSEGDVLKANDGRRRRSLVKKEGEEKESCVQRTSALLGALREIKETAEQLRLKEPTLPALQQRSRALTELESRLAAHLTELQYIQEESSQSRNPDVSQTREVEDVWEETKKAVTERLEQCNVVTELLKRFQSIRGELSGTLQRAESTISEQASYMGKDNLQRLHTKVQETKAELNGLGDGIEEVRSVCRQLHTHLRQIPELIIPFEGEADALMDRWLDISERTDSHLENIHLGLTLWDGILHLGAEVENWTANKLAVFAQSPSFQTEEDISALRNEIVAQEENMERFHRKTIEIQVLLQSSEPHLELQVVETQMRKKMEQLKELVSEAEDVYRQLVAAKGQITARMAECFNSLQKIQDSLLTLSGSDVATVLAKLKELFCELQTQGEQTESLLEDLHVMASIASSSSLQSLSVDGMQLQDKVKNTHQLFSEVEEQTERNIQALNRLQRVSAHLEQWLQAVEEKAVKEEDLSLLQEEVLQQRVRTEALNQLVSTLQSSPLQQSALVKESSKLLERYHNFQTNTLHGFMERQSSLSRDIGAFQSLSKSTQSWFGDLRHTVDSPLGESLDIQSPVEQRLHHAQAVVSAKAEGEARLEELRVIGNDMSHRLCDGDDLKRDIQETIQKTEEQWKDLLQSVESHHSVLQGDLELTSSYLAQRQQACRTVEALQHRTARLPTLFPWPGTAERRQVCLLARQLQDETESLLLTLTSLAEQRREMTERSSDTIWKDSSSAELETCLSSLKAELLGVCSRLEEGVCNEEHFGQLLQECHHKLTSLQEKMSACQAQKEISVGMITDVPALEALLQEVTDTEKCLLEILTLKDSITASSTAEAQSSLSQQVSNLQNHKMALDSSIREALLTEISSQGVQHVRDEVSCVQSALKHLAEDVGNLCGNREALLDISQLKQQWYTIQDCDTRLKELAARVNNLQKPAELSNTQEKLPAAVILTIDAVAKDLDSFRSIYLQKKQECSENTANRVRQVISQLHKWSQTVQAEPSSASPAAVDEGLLLQQAVHDVLSERDFLLHCLGRRATKELEKSASDALSESKPKVETLSKSLIQESMEPERTASGLASDLQTTGGSPESYKQKSTMQDILSEIQSLVERSNIINRTPHIDLNWYLKSSPDEPEIRLVRTVQKVLICRYKPAQLDIMAMVKQLKEAEDYRRCVQEQVVTMKSIRAARICDPDALKSAEEQWSAALLDASATVQVKAAQLDQVKQYHKQMKITRAFLEVVAVEKDKMSLKTLGSSALQADKLHALLQTMVQKKDMIEELLQLSSQLSIHLSKAESSGALLAQLEDIQEEWRLLEGSIKRALQHASSSATQSSLLIKEAEHLKAKLESLQTTNFQSHDCKSALEFFCLTTDLKLYKQLYLHLQSQSDALVHFSLGQKEKDEIKRCLQELGSLLNVTKSKHDTSLYSCGSISSAKINKQLQDLIMWAKEAENHITIVKRLALFPEEARIQIVEMKKFQTDIWYRRSKMQEEVEQMKYLASDMEKEESDQVLKTVENMYEAIADSLDHVLGTMKKNLQERETLLYQLASMDAWLAETHAKRDPYTHVDNISKADIRKLESELKNHKLVTAEIESHLKLVEAMAESCREIAVGLSPGESRYLVNRLSGLWTELDGLLAHEKATSWELEELIHEQTSLDEELSTIQASLQQISTDLKEQRFPLTQETFSTIAHLKHMLMEHQCQVQELQHCQEAKRSSLLCTIGELQDQCKTLTINIFEQVKYLHLRRQIEESCDIAKKQTQRAKDKTISVGQRFRLCQTLLVDLPLVKTQCQEAADQLEAIAQDLYPSELNSERQKIQSTVETLVSLECSVTDDIKNLEAKLLLGLCFSSELPALIELFQRTKVELEGAEQVNPDEKAIDIALRRYWVIWRNMESGMRVLEGLGRKEEINLKNYKELYSLRDTTMQECSLRMESLSQARESLKDYQWAAQVAIGFLHNAEATFLSAPGGFLDCTEEQRQTQQALDALEDGFQVHICHLADVVPHQTLLSCPETEQLHISILSQLLVGRAILEAQAKLRLETLQRCEIRQEIHRKCHEDISQHLSALEKKLSECAAEQVTSYDKCVAQQKRAKVLMEDVRSLAGKIEELRAGCPMQGCGVGKGGELDTLWRRWVSLRGGVGLLMAHTEQRAEEWKDITTSMEQCCSFLASLQAEVPDSSTVSFTQEEPQELLVQAEMHQVGLEQEQQALASLEHRLEHALSLSSSQDPISPGPIGKTLVKIQENVRSLKERNLLVVAAAQAEVKKRQQLQEDIGEVEQHVFAILPLLEACSNPYKQQELSRDLSSQKTKLKCIMDSLQSQYAEIPADISKRLQEVQLSLQREQEKKSDPVQKLADQVVELGSGLEKVKALLEKRSPTVNEAQNVLKHVWDELDAWHSCLMLLENEVQDLAEENPDQAHLLMDQLTQPLQLYQNAAQMAEQRTAFLSKIPACLQEFEDILYSATCWLDEAQSWLTAPCSFTTARSLQNHANSLQLVLDDSERIRHTLQDFRLVLEDISAVCDISTQVESLDQNDQQVHKMQHKILEPLEQLLQDVAVVEAIEAELKAMDKNVLKIKAILSSMDNSNIPLTEHLHNRQVILANMQLMRRTLEEVERCKKELHLPQGAQESLLIFSRARQLLQPLEELEQLTQQQATMLENKIREEDLCITTVSDTPEEIQQLDGSPQRYFQEDFEVSNSEEEEDEENESCHSSSSDTLTCSIPEDPEETLNASDAQREDIDEIKPLSEVKALKSLASQFSSEVEMSTKGAETGFLSMESGLDTKESESENDPVETGLITMDSKADVGKAFSPETVMAESLIAAAIPAAENKSIAVATLDQHGSPKHETLVTAPHTKKSFQAAAPVEDTRLIPARPITPFTSIRASDEFTEEGDGNLSLSTALHQDLDTLNMLNEQSEDSRSSLAEESQSSKLPISLAGHEEDEEQLRWRQLYTQISHKLTTLNKVKEEHETMISSDDGGTHEKVPEMELILTGSTSAVLQRTHESVTMLRHIVTPADDSHPGGNEELYRGVQRVLLCLDALTDLLLTPGGAGEDDPQLRLLQQECVSTELVTLAELLSKVESETRPALSKKEPEALCCLTSLQDCLHTVQLVFSSSHKQLIEHFGITYQHQEPSSNQLCILDEFELGRSETFPRIKDAPNLEQCVLGRHLREIPGGTAKLQQASQSLLQGITRLLELGEECITEGQMSQFHNHSQLQAVLCRHKKLLQVLRSQLAFVQHLFQREPEALRCQEDERVQLEVRAKALQQQALEQEVACQRRIQEWTRWEDNCGRLSKLLDDLEAFISSGEPEGDDEKVIQHRQDACQQTLVQLDESRVALRLLLDQGKVLQTDPGFAATVSHAGGALELRWQRAYRRTEQEIQRCRDMRDSQARFQTDFASVSEWLVGSNKRLKTWSNLADTPDLNEESINNNLIKLLDFSMELKAMSKPRTSVSREATQVLRLREADCPRLRAQLAKMEVNWSQLTSDLSKIQDQLQQRLLVAWPPVKLLSDLEDWLKKLEARLSQEKETVLKAKDAAQITEILQHYQELKAGMINGQLLLDFLCQSGPQVLGVDAKVLCSERTMFAEKLGAVRLQWLHLQRELESQICEVEQIHHTCADRERQLHRLNGWIEQQKKQLNQWRQPTSRTVARKALLELEAVVGKGKEEAAALQELKAPRVHVEKEEDHPCDISFSGQTESICHACGDLCQQMESLRPALQQTVEEWSCFDSDLREVSLHTTRLRCALQYQPLFSLKQAEGYKDLLQQLQEKVRKGEQLWASLDKSYQSLVKTLHHGTAQALEDQMEEERKRWQDVVQELKDEHMKTGETLSLWQEYIHLSDQCSLHLQNLSHQCEGLSRASSQQDTQAVVHSVEKLQDAAKDLQSRVGDVLAASKPLIGRLEPLAANLIQSETRLLSRDVLLLSQAMSRKKKSLQEDLKQQKQFHAQLEALEKQTRSNQLKLKASLNHTESVEQVLLELSDLFPSLFDVREMSGYVTLNKNYTERLHMLSRQWVESMTRLSDMNRELQFEHQHSQSFQEKCKNLTSIQTKLEEQFISKKDENYSSLQEMLTVHQRLEVVMNIGHQILQGILCHAVESVEKETGEKRSKLMAQVTRMRESWLNSVALAGQHRSLIKEQLGQWRVYHHGLKLLWKLMMDVDPLLPPAGPALCTLHQLRSCTDNFQCVEDALGLHSTVYTQTLEAGRHLCKTMTGSECQSRLQSDLQAIQEAWEQTTSLLERRRALISTTVQKYSQCQDGITSIMSELDELKVMIKQTLPERPYSSEDKEHLQKTELSLQRLASGLRELTTMKTDLSQYVAAGDSALLEQQLEQLHSQWEELCMKVSLRRQEIADRLNAWTIFNDKNKEFHDWLTQMENKVCHSGDLSIEEMVEKLKKDCMEEINLFSENKSHLKQLGEQLLLASDEAKQTRVHGSLLEVNQRWHNLFHHIEARVKKLKETLVTVQQLDKNMSNLRSWLSRMESELSRPITYSVCHHQEIQRRLAEQQELQRDIEQHTEGVVSVISLCDVLLRDEDAAGGTEVENDSLQETSHSLDQRWRTICAMALDRRLRIEETWRLWCKFLDDYSRFEDWLKIAERTAANPSSADVLYTVAKEELKKFESFQRQVNERLTQLELVNNQYRRLARENRTDRASQLKAMVHEGNRRWDTLHRRVAAILRRLKYFTSQREEFEGTRENMLVWLTELDLQLTNVEHFSESDIHHKIQQLNSFQKEITLNTERIDGLIVFGEGLIQKSSPQDAALIEDELEELHSYCQEVFSRLVRFHQRLSQPPTIKEEPEISSTSFSLESSLELIGRPWLGRSQGSLPATPTHLLASPLERSGRETPVSVDSLPLEWDHTGDVGGSSSHEDDEVEEGEHEDERIYFSASEVELTESQEEYVEAPEALQASSLVSSRSMAAHDSPRWRSQEDKETESLQLDSEGHTEAPPNLTSTPLKQGYLHLMSQCSGSIEDIKRVSLILDDEEQPEELGLTGLTASDKQSGVIERWELLQARSRSYQHDGLQEPQELISDLDDITSWLEDVIPELERLQQVDPAASVEDMATRAKELKEMQKTFTRYKSVMLSVNLRAQEAPELQERLARMNRDWSRACTGLQLWDTSMRKTLMRCQEFHETLHSLLLWLAHAESRRYAVDISHPDTPVRALQHHHKTLTNLQEELDGRQTQQASLQALWSQLQPEDEAEESDEAQEKLHVTSSKLKLLLRQVDQDLSTLQQRLDRESSEVQGQSTSADLSEEATNSKKGSSSQREKRDSPPPRSFFSRVLRAAFPLHLLLLFLLLLPCLIPMSESDPSCTGANNFAWSFYPMLRYTNGPPPT
ncbi:nesprin-2 isoform X3 [Micropterus dolomieu]|uniref:nesprin-2 isoform X3 n=1 Tax=Micropterus dolomieu TaxID=147949 RepID=UPI001E8E8A05|nr:nesprin-2 isoform X3 [Micropterus dolomieu]